MLLFAVGHAAKSGASEENRGQGAPSGEPTLSVRLLRPFAAVLQDEGISLAVLLDAAAIPHEIYSAPDGRVPYSAAGRFLAAACERTAFAALGLEAARRLDAAQFQLLEYLAASSPNVAAALETLVRYQSVFGDRHVLSLDDISGGRLLRFQPSQGAPRCFIEYVLGGLALASLRAGPLRSGTHELGQVWFAYPAPAALSAYRDFFGREPRFDAAAHGIFVPRVQLTQPMVRANTELQALLAHQIAAPSGAPAPPRSTTERVRALLAQNLAGTPLSLARTARRLSMSASTLKRRLFEEGKSYSALLDELRRQTALQLLKDTRLPVAEVAYLSGYTDVTAFDKAFRRWTGRSPSQHRGKR